LELTVQGAVLPEVDIDAQTTFDAVDVGGQPLGAAVIAIIPEAPAEPALMLLVLNPYEQATPDCETLTPIPAIVKLPLRLSELGLALTDQDTLLPETDTEAQLTPELAVTAQSPGLGVTAIFPVPPAGPALTLAGFKA
jgi:hypothetical protein